MRNLVVVLCVSMMACLLSDVALGQSDLDPSIVITADQLNPEQVKHLLAAAKHLEAASLPTAAHSLRRRAVLAQKLAEMAELQQEIHQLRQGEADRRHVQIAVHVVKLSRVKLQSAAAELAELCENRPAASLLEKLLDLGQIPDGDFGGSREPMVVEADGTSELVDMLRQRKIISVISRPQVVTINGQAASFECGRSDPVLIPQQDGSFATESRWYGTRAKLSPTVLPDGSIRLELQLLHSEPQQVGTSSATRQVGTQAVEVLRTMEEVRDAASPRHPPLDVVELQTTVQLLSGETLVVGGLVRRLTKATAEVGAKGQPDMDDSQTELLVFATPQLIELGVPPPAKTAQRILRARDGKSQSR